MSVTPGGAGSRLDISKVISDTTDVIKRNLSTFALAGLLMVGLPGALNGVVRFTIKSVGSLAAASVIVGLVSLVLSLAFQAGLFYATDLDLNGRPWSMPEMLSVGFRKAAPLLGLSILVILAGYFGLFLFIVPGILLFLRWSVAGPAMVIEGRGILKSMGRSAALTKGRRGSVLLLCVAVGILLLVIDGVFLSVVGGASGLTTLRSATTATPGNVLGALIVTPVIGAAFTVVSAVLFATLFHHLRVSREGVAAQNVAEVFA